MIYIFNSWKFKNVLLNNSSVKKDFKIDIADYFKMNNNIILDIKAYAMCLKPFQNTFIFLEANRKHKRLKIN